MKKFLSYIFIGVIAIGLCTPFILYAQNLTPGQQQVYEYLIAQGEPEASAREIAAGSDPGDRLNTEQKAGQGNSDSTNSCGFTNPGAWGQCILGTISYTLMTIMSLLVWITGTLLNYVLKVTIVDMAANIKGMTGINIAWKLIKDLMNIAFIFLLVWEGIKMILGIGKEGAKNLIVGIIISAILINFSLFFTKVIIDASNVVTIGFYKAILGDKLATANEGLSNPITTAVGLTKIYGNDAVTNFVKNTGGDKMAIIITGLGSSILFLVISFVFLAVSVMFIIRYIVLILLLMTSPIAYMGWALPAMDTYAKDWWTTLRGQALFAPIYMIMTWVILTLMTSGGFTTIGGGQEANYSKILLGADGKPDVNSIGLLLNFALITGLVIASLLTAKSFATKGSKMIGEATKWGTAAAGGALFGGAARLGQQTVGRLGNRMANSEWMKDKAASGGMITRNFAKASLTASNKAAGASFDVRASKAGGSLSKTLGVDYGKVDAKKSNFRGDLEAKTKAAEEMTKMLKPSDDAADKAKALSNSSEFNSEAEKVRKTTYVQKKENEINNLRRNYDVEVQKLASQKDTYAYKLIKERDDVATTAIRKQEIEKLIRDDISIQNKIKDLSAVEKEITKREKEIKDTREPGWISEEKAKVIAMAGGQEEKGSGDTKQRKVESLYAQRADEAAKKVEGESWMSRYTKNVFLRVPGMAASIGSPTSAADNRAIARKMRAVAKAKKKIDAKALKDLGIDIEEEKKEETPAEPAAAPAPAAPATP